MRRRHSPIALKLAWAAGGIGFIVVLAVFAWHDGVVGAISSGLMILLLIGLLLMPEAAVAALFARISDRLAVRKRRLDMGYCPRCGYDLRGDLNHRCPECGWMNLAPAGEAERRKGSGVVFRREKEG